MTTTSNFSCSFRNSSSVRGCFRCLWGITSSRRFSSWSTTSSGIRLRGIVAVIFPPSRLRTSWMTGSWPFIRSCQATDSPAAPPPMTAIFLPVAGAGAGTAAWRLARPRSAVSTAGRSASLAGAVLHAEIGAQVAADRGRKGGVRERQIHGFLHLSLADQLPPLPDGDPRRTVGLTGRKVFFVFPEGDESAQIRPLRSPRWGLRS